MDQQRDVSPYTLFYIGALCLGVLAYSLLTIFGEVGRFWSYLAGVNVATLILFGYDKSVAGTGALRVPERVVYTCAILGGVPGLVLGMTVFRHKTRKAGFSLYLLLILAIQLIGLTLLLGDPGSLLP